MDTTAEWRPAELKRQLAAHGISAGRLALEAKVYPHQMYGILGGAPVGATVRARILEAARELGVTDEAAEQNAP